MSVVNLPSIADAAGFDTAFESPVWDDAALTICTRHKIGSDDLMRCPSTDHVVFSIGGLYTLKIFRPSRQCFTREMKALEFVHGRSPFKTPEIVHTGEIEGFDYIVMTQLRGVPMTRMEFLALPEADRFKLVTKLATGLKRLHEHKTDAFDCDWAAFVE